MLTLVKGAEILIDVPLRFHCVSVPLRENVNWSQKDE